MIRVGQKLWAINKKTNIEESVEVIEITSEHFFIRYKEKTGKYPLSDLNNKFYEKPQRQPVPSCDNCFLRHSDACSSLSGIPCEDYRAKQNIPKSEQDAWPRYGDVTAFRLKDRDHFK